MIRCILGTVLLSATLSGLLQPATAANSLVGTWRGFAVANGMRLQSDLVLDSRGRFTELTRTGSLMSQRMGKWLILPNGNLRLTVIDWAPKQQCVAPSGCFPIRMPPGSQYRVRFTSPNTALFTDVTFGRATGTITYRRGF